MSDVVKCCHCVCQLTATVICLSGGLHKNAQEFMDSRGQQILKGRFVQGFKWEKISIVLRIVGVLFNTVYK